MYHRFDENKYPSTNIRMPAFKKQINYIENLEISFLNAKNLNKKISEPNMNKLVLLTIDDAYLSFYENAWPFLKKKNIPFLLFVSTEFVGKKGYMSWKQIQEIEENELATIGNHSHSHDYLVDKKKIDILKDIKKSINIFKNKLGYNPKYFSYPFGEYSEEFKKIVDELKFEFAFGQHSGVIDLTKDKLELPRFPINEKYGDLERFKFILKLYPFQYKEITPKNKYLQNFENPPIVKIVFFENQKNINKIKCYSNENNMWQESKIQINKNVLKIIIEDKFMSERGRINCSLHDNVGWRWLGMQFVIKDY